MDNFDPHLNINDFRKTRDSSEYISKEIEINNSNLKVIKTPLKIIDGNKINGNIGNKINIKNPIFESCKFVVQPRSWNSLHYLLEEAEKDKISGLDTFFGIKKGLWDNNFTALSLAFARNPFKEQRFQSASYDSVDMDHYIDLLYYIHSASSAFVLTPDIRIEKEEIITLDQYIKFIDDSVDVLSERNHKPIFVPLQIHLNQKRMNKLLEHYKTQNYTNIWINFNGSHIGGTYFTRVKSFIRRIDNIMGLKNCALYFSHIKKEINPNIKDDKCIASDILTQFFGADFIGVNREPTRFMKKGTEAERTKELILKGEFENEYEYNVARDYNKSRIFDPKSYYNYNIDIYPDRLPFPEKKLVDNKELNKFLNSTFVYSEIENVKNFVEKNRVINTYLKSKKAIMENSSIKEAIIPESRQAGLFEYLGGFKL